MGLAVLAAALIMSAAMGIRQSFGLLLGPLAVGEGLSITTVAFAIALHNLAWGVAQPFAGAAADRHGALPVVLFGAFAYAGGLILAALAPNTATLILGMGLLVGIGISCTSFGVVMTAVGKAAPPEARTMAMGLASAGGSFGQALVVPVVQSVTVASGVAMALLVLAALIVTTAPLGRLLCRKSPPSAATASPTSSQIPLRETLIQAGRHPGYRLLTAGFFACGFQLAFIATYLPGYLSLCQMPAGLGATALMLIGLFNMIGSWGCGWLGGRYHQAPVLGWLYLIRGVVIAAFVFLPKSDVSVVAFAAIMGLTWLGTVPLTSGLIARMFGVSHLGALFGLCFLSHQLGSFLGAWAGGLVFDLTGSYAPVWIATAAAGGVAALLHFLIDSRRVDAPFPARA